MTTQDIVSTQQTTYTGRIVRRIVLGLAITIGAFAALAVTGIFNSAIGNLRDTHRSALQQASIALENTLRTAVDGAQIVAANNDLVAFLEGGAGTENEAFGEANDFHRQALRLNPQYRAIRVLALDGAVLLETRQENGIISETAPAVLSQRRTRYNGDAATFDTALTLANDESIFGPLRSDARVRDTIILDVLTPVETTLGLIGVVQIELNADAILSDVSLVHDRVFDADANRRIVLVSGDRIAADSASATAAQLQSAQAVAVEARDPVYTQAIEQAQRLPDGTTGAWSGAHFVSASSLPLSDVVGTPWTVMIFDTALPALLPALIGSALIVMASAFFIFGGAAFIEARLVPLLAPVDEAERLTRQLAQGEGLTPPPRTVASAPLTQSVAQVAERIAALESTLDEQLERRARDVQVAGRIGRDSAQHSDLNAIMHQALNVICTEMDFYHAQVFLVDAVNTYAVLAYSRGEAGQKLLASGHKLRVGGDSIIGTCTAQKRPVVVNDTARRDGENALHGFNPYLPNTRAEMGLPLYIGDEVIGVLDIQSLEPNVFLPEDIPTYQLLADQLAVAIYNARLREETEARLEEIERLNRQLTAEAWAGTRQSVYGPADVNGKLAVPVALRGEVFGTIEAALPDDRDFSEADRIILETLANRVALAVENARLFEQTQATLSETSVLYNLSRRLNEADDLEEVLAAIISRVAVGATGAQMWLFSEHMPGDTPEWVRLNVDYRADPAAHDADLVGTHLKFSGHSFFQRLTPDHAMLLPDVRQEDTGKRLRDLFERLGARGMIFVPLNLRGLWRGFLSIEFPRPRTFTEQEQRLYDSLIGQAGVTIDNRLLLQQTEAALARQERLYASSRIINTAQNLSELVYSTIATANDPTLDFWISTLENTLDGEVWASQAQLMVRSEGGQIVEDRRTMAIQIAPTSPMKGREPQIIHSDQPPDEGLSAYVDLMDAFGYQTMTIFPLFSDSIPIALFHIVSRQNQRLTADDYEVYKALTGMMSTQIENRRLLLRTEAALDETRRLYVATRAIASAADMVSIYQSVYQHIAEPFLVSPAYQHDQITLSILLAHPEPRMDAPYLRYEYFHSNHDDAIHDTRIGRQLDHQHINMGELLEDSDEGLLIYHNLSSQFADRPHLYEVFAPMGEQSVVIVPLWSRRQWYGVLMVHASASELIDAAYTRFVQAVADQVAITIENQQLLFETESERRRLNTILSTLPTGVLVLDPKTLVPQQHNERVEALLNQPIDYASPFTAQHYQLCRTGTELPYPDDEMPIRVAQREQRPVLGDDLSIISAEYGKVDLLVSAAPIYGSDEHPIAIVAAFQDISTLRSMESTMQESLRETLLLYETQRSLANADSLDNLLDNIIGQLGMQQASDAHIVIQKPEERTLRLERSLIRPLSDIQVLRPIFEREIIVVPDVEDSPYVNDLMRQVFLRHDIRSVMTIPLHSPSQNTELGWMVLVDAEPDAFTTDQERVLSSIGDMASNSLENSILVQRTQAALGETANLYAATTAISRARDLNELYTALQQALRTLQPDMWAGFLYQDKADPVEMFKYGFEDSEANGLDFAKLLEMPLHNADGVYVADVSRSTLGEFEMEMLQGGNIKAFSAVNLRVKDTPGGRLFVGYRQPHRFTEGETRFMDAVADSASVVIDNQLLLEQVQSTLQETSVLYQASKALLDSTTPDEIVDVVVNFLIEPHVNQVFIVLLNGDSWDHPNASVEVAATWQYGTDVDLRGVTLSADQFPAWRQLAVSSVMVIGDLYDPELDMDPIEQTSIISLDIRSLVIIPLRVSNRAIGAIWLGSQEPYRYSERDLRMFGSFGEQTSLTLEARRLLEQTENRARQLETSATISQNVGQILDLDVLLPQVVDLIKDQFDYDQVQVFLMDEEDEWALLRASTGAAGQQLLAINHKLRRGSRSVIGQVSELGRPTIALDTADADVIHQPNEFLPLTRSEMAIPLIVKGEVVGALDVQSNQPNAFDDEDLQVLTALANQISVAIDNARLYDTAQRSARDMSFLFEISRAAAAANDLDTSMRSVANMIYTTSQIQTAVVAIYLPTYYEDHFGNQKILMQLAAIRSDDPVNTANTAAVEVGNPKALLGVATQSLQYELIHDVSQEPRYRPLVAAAQSAILMPLSAGSDVVGCLVLESRRANAYDADAIGLLQPLASSLSAIVQNRLLLVQLQKSNEQLREVDKLKSDFLASMSHELRTPLNSIIGFSRVMLKGIDGPLTEMQEQDLNTIYTSGNHLLNLINDVLDQAKIEANKLNLKFTYFEIKPMIEGVKSIAIGLLNDRPELQLRVEIAPSLPQAFGDEFRTRQILLNIVTNAIKFTQEGSVTIRAYGIAGRQGPMIRVDIEDTGIGIAEDEIDIIFQSFRQADSSLTRAVGGTGLGLPISKSLAELQGGELMVVSEVNVGSIFSVTIPTYKGAERVQEERNRQMDAKQTGGPETTLPIQSSPQNGSLADTTETNQTDFDPTETGVVNPEYIEAAKQMIADGGSKPTRPSKSRQLSLEEQKRQTVSTPIPGMNQKRDVILVEDDKRMVDQFRRILQREGFEVTTADLPAFAEAMIGQIRPSVVILDVNFAQGQGWTILENLKERDDTFDIPIVVTTLESDSERAYRLGAHTYLQRPFERDALLEAVLAAERESQRERILIIDDQPDAIRLLEQLLGEHGDFKVFSAQSGDEGISLVARRRPDLIILDLRMPDKDGFAVLDELRGNPETAKIPVLIVTGDIDLSADELARLANIRILPKADISQEEYDLFIDNVRSYLEADNSK